MTFKKAEKPSYLFLDMLRYSLHLEVPYDHQTTRVYVKIVKQHKQKCITNHKRHKG